MTRADLADLVSKLLNTLGVLYDGIIRRTATTEGADGALKVCDDAYIELSSLQRAWEKQAKPVFSSELRTEIIGAKQELGSLRAILRQLHETLKAADTSPAKKQTKDFQNRHRTAEGALEAMLGKLDSLKVSIGTVPYARARSRVTRHIADYRTDSRDAS